MSKIILFGIMAICLAAIIMPVDASDYVIGENVTMFIQLMDDGSPIPNSTCMLKILYPNRTVFMEGMVMDYMSDDGIFYYELVAPEPDGTYMAYVICNITEPYQRNITGTGELHISIPTITVACVSGTEYIAGETGIVSAQFLKAVGASNQPINDGTCNVTVYYPNWTAFLDNHMMTYASGSNGIYFINFTIPSDIGIYTSDFTCTKAPTTRYGSGSFHISRAVNYSKTAPYVWNFSVRNLTYYNNSVIIDEIRGLSNLTDEEVWSYVNRTLTDFGFTVNATLTAEEIWSYSQRNLTFYNQSDMWAYFAYWNDSLFIKWDDYFYFWNNSYFDAWNETLEGALPADFRRVWEEFNCTTSPENVMCQRLATCSSITCETGISSGGTPAQTVIGLDEHIVSLIAEGNQELVGGLIETAQERAYDWVLPITLVLLVLVVVMYYAFKRGVRDVVKEQKHKKKNKIPGFMNG